jgi:prepilin-type N-terminal cleavage/methylation domain-containing protein
MKTSRRSGFTLVELLVAMAVFSVVLAIATGAFIRALRTQRQLVSFASANSNVSLVLEQMAREIRVGRDFTQVSGGTLSFTNGRGEVVTYRYEAESESITRTVGNSTPRPLTSESVAVKNLEFLGQFVGDDGYPARITTMVAVSPKEVGVDTSVVRIQTTVSARNIGT